MFFKKIRQTWHELVVVGDADVVALLGRLDVLAVGRVGPDVVLVHLHLEKVNSFKDVIMPS